MENVKNVKYTPWGPQKPLPNMVHYVSNVKSIKAYNDFIFSWNALDDIQWNAQRSAWKLCITLSEQQGLSSAFALTHFAAERKCYATVHLHTVNLTQSFGKGEEHDTQIWRGLLAKGGEMLYSREPGSHAACWESGARAVESQLKTSGLWEKGWHRTRNMHWARNMLFLPHSMLWNL